MSGFCYAKLKYMDNPENLLVLILVGIFAFATATLFRSNKALDRVGDVERELGNLEDEVKEVKESEVKILQKNNFQPSEINSHPPVTNSNVETPFPEDSAVHKE